MRALAMVMAVALCGPALAQGGGEARSGVVRIVTEMPDMELAFDAPPEIEELKDLDIVDLTLGFMPGTTFRAMGAGQQWRELGADCGFGEVEDVAEISLPTGSNHILMTVRPGRPDLHAANIVGCEYAPGFATEDGEMMRLTVRGCYLVRELGVPTARLLVLNPMPPAACGIGE